MGLEAAELARWTRFAAKGGIGKCIATCDCVAESADDLMFLKDDEITVLLQLPDREGFYLGYCEGVVGRFAGQDVRFTSKLKKPVMTKRSSSMVASNPNANKSPSPTVSASAASPSPTPRPSTSYHTQHGATQRTSATPSPSAFRSVSVSSLNSHTRAESLERTGERRGSAGMGVGVRHPASPLSTARALAPDNEQEDRRNVTEREGHIRNAFATLHEVALAEAAAGGNGGQTRHGSVGSTSIGSRKEYQYSASPLGTPSPREVQFSRADSRGERDDSRSDTHTGSPRHQPSDRQPVSTECTQTQGHVSSSSSQTLSTTTSTSSTSFTFTTASSSSSPQTSPPSSPRSLHTQSHSLQQHKYTAHAPSPLTLYPDQYSGAGGAAVPSTFTSPLRITKRSPVPGSVSGFTSNTNSTLQQMQRSPPPMGSLPLLPGSPPASARTHPVNTSSLVSHSLTAPIRTQVHSLSPSASSFSTGPGLSPSTTAFSPLSSPSVYSSPPHSAAPTVASFSSSPSHTATFAHRLGLDSVQGSPASFTHEGGYAGDTVGSSPATLAHEDGERGVGVSPFSGGHMIGEEQNRSEAEGEAQMHARQLQELRDTSADAAGVSIGLSLLEGLIGSYSDDESDEDEDPEAQYSDEDDDPGRTKEVNRVSTMSKDSTTASEGGTAEGLGYARSEESYTVHEQRQATPSPVATQNDDHDEAEHVRRESAPHITQPTPPLDQQHLSPAASPTSSAFPTHATQPTSRERRPSLAPSASSVYSVRSGASASTGVSARSSSWEGAADIYDDYRYSRASVRPNFDAMSVRSGGGGISGGGERRPSFDSVGNATGGYFGGMGVRRERVDSGASSLFGATRLGGLIEGVERDDKVIYTGGEGSRDREAAKDTEQHVVYDNGSDKQQPSRTTPEDDHVHPRLHHRTTSADSDASVYTQNSRLSTLSRDLTLPSILAGLASTPPQGNDKDNSDVGDQGELLHLHARPPPLALSLPGSEPLLHTTWGSAVSSPGMSPPGITAYTPVPGKLDVEGRGLYNPGGVVSQRPVGSEIGNREDEGGGLKSPTTITGFASAMRMRLEEDRLARATETRDDDDNRTTEASQYEDTGLGSRIVVEDEDELPSRIVNETFDSQADTTTDVYPDGGADHKGSSASTESHDTDATATNLLHGGANSSTNTTASSSPEPEILGGLGLGLGLGGHLAPLVVMNRTPSPSLLEGASDDGRLDQPEAVGSSIGPQVNIAAITSSTTSPSSIPSQASPSAPSPTPSPAPSHLRPSLADLREPTGAPLPGTDQRRSLFLPHPNAPKAPAGLVSPGPMYIAAQQQAGAHRGPPVPGGQSQGVPGFLSYNSVLAAQGQNQQMQHAQRQLGAPRMGVLAVIRMALSRPPPPLGPARTPHQMRGPTIYGRTETELGAALGPVPIAFSVEPPAQAAGRGAAAGQGQGKGSQLGAPPTSPPRVQIMVKGAQQKQSVPRSMSMGPGVPSNSASSANATPTSIPSISNAASGSGNDNANLSTSFAVPGTNAKGEQKIGPIPRANFFPKATGLRPRSRSFSGFNSTSTEMPLPLQRSREDAEIISAKDIHRSLTSRASSASLSSSSSQPAPSNSSSAQIKAGSAPLRPSPLSLSRLSSTGRLKPSPTSPIVKSPSSPLAQSFTIPPTSEVVSAPQSSKNSLSVPSITANLGGSGAGAVALDAVNSKATHQVGETPSRATLNESLLRSSPNMHSKTPLDAPPSLVSSVPGRTASLQINGGRVGVGSPQIIGSTMRSSSSHSMMDLRIGEPRAQVSPPLSVARQSSLRSKLSLPNLRRKQSRQDEDPSVNTNVGTGAISGTDTIASPTSPNSVGPAMMYDPEMLQVKDMEFELVRPNLAHHFSQAARTSEDSGVLGRDGSFDLRQESSSFLRAESPAFSVSSGGGGGASSILISGQRSPTIEGGRSSQTALSASVSPPPGASRPPTDSESSMDAHRQRELKWMALMGASPAASARKSKKVRKLVVEGVPSSVRYLVWSYLTDGKARCVPGVYTQLCARGKVGVASRIEEDIKRGFRDTDGDQEQLYSHLQGTQGPVGTLLSAYLNMVPDVQYSMGLTLIVGQLLLLAPEEDAFWIFVSIMDTHIRSYFSSATSQMEVDAALFSRALENNDPQLARKILVDMNILPTAICQPWFSTLFVGTLPPEYLNRVWDLFLFEGVPFLVRVALALMQCCRRRILESTSDESVFHTLRHPPPSLLPPTPDAFLSLAFGVKHKDDDMRKQRVKMEAQVKRQTQVPRTASTSGMISLPRS